MMRASVHGTAHARTGNRPKSGIDQRCQRIVRGCCELQAFGCGLRRGALQNFRQKYVADAGRDTSPAR
jgi:hypothetical protein